MGKYSIVGGSELKGDVFISGAKNAALPLMAATLLTKEEVVLNNIPLLHDILVMKNLLEEIGKKIQFKDNTMYISESDNIVLKASYETVRTMRASICVLGPLLGRFKKAMVSLPGGCTIGTRPVDMHIKAMESLGGKLSLDNGYIIAETEGLRGCTMDLLGSNGVTVLGTSNAMMAAVLAEGETIIESAALEPEVVDVGELLISMGAKIEGLGTSCIKIKGVQSLHGTTYKVIPDRIEAGTFLAMVGACGGKIEMHGINDKYLKNPLEIAREIGLSIEVKENSLVVESKGDLKAVDITTEPYPKFPTDLQSQYMAMLLKAEGNSLIEELIFEDRLKHVAEFRRMGAKVKIKKGFQALVTGVKKLKGAPVEATDLRAGASLVIAALSASGKTYLDEIEYIHRGYEQFDEKIRAIGGDIKIENQ